MKKTASRSLGWGKTALLPLFSTVLAVAFCACPEPILASENVLPSLNFSRVASTSLLLAQAAQQQPTDQAQEPKAETAGKEAPPQQPSKPDEAKPAASEKPAKTEGTAKQKEAEKEKDTKSEKSELDNQSCYDCHNPDILNQSPEERLENVVVEDKPAPPRAKIKFSFGELSLSIDEKKYSAGVHADTTCVECHKDVEELPHQQRLKLVDCSSCHEESVEQVKESAHGETALEKGLSCVGCHDVHYGKGKDSYATEFRVKACADCHKAYGLPDTAQAHRNLHEYELHAKTLGCLWCHHAQADRSVHTIPHVKTKVTGCEECHNKNTILSKTRPEPKDFDFFSYITSARFINADVLKEYGYVVGAHRIPLLDTIIILVVLGPLGLPVVHGGLRVLTRRKGPIELPEEKILLHPVLERIWHWFQALCIVMLIITGIILHWPEWFPTWFDWAVTWHNWFGWGAVIAWIFWLIYNLATGRIWHYIPRKGEIPGGMITQAKFYGYGIFKHEPHPYAPTEDNKFNPLQKIAYLKFQLFLFPLLLVSGLLYMYPMSFAGIIDAIGGTTVLAVIHYILGGLFAAFLVAHMYLATTGETVSENFKAIVFGYGIKSDHHGHHV